MGSFGSGIFQNDAALDTLGLEMEQLVMKMYHRLQWKDDGTTPWWQEDALALAEMIYSIAARCPYDGCTVADARLWMALYLEHFDRVASSRDCKSDPHVLECRKVAEDVFSRLIEAGARDEDGGDGEATMAYRYARWLANTEPNWQ